MGKPTQSQFNLDGKSIPMLSSTSTTKKNLLGIDSYYVWCIDHKYFGVDIGNKKFILFKDKESLKFFFIPANEGKILPFLNGKYEELDLATIKTEVFCDLRKKLSLQTKIELNVPSQYLEYVEKAQILHYFLDDPKYSISYSFLVNETFNCILISYEGNAYIEKEACVLGTRLKVYKKFQIGDELDSFSVSREGEKFLYTATRIYGSGDLSYTKDYLLSFKYDSEGKLVIDIYTASLPKYTREPDYGETNGFVPWKYRNDV